MFISKYGAPNSNCNSYKDFNRKFWQSALIYKSGCIKANPDRPNTFFVNIMRLTNIDKNLDTIIDPLCNELKEKKEHFSVTIVYVENLESLGYV